MINGVYLRGRTSSSKNFKTIKLRLNTAHRNPAVQYYNIYYILEIFRRRYTELQYTFIVYIFRGQMTLGNRKTIIPVNKIQKRTLVTLLTT